MENKNIVVVEEQRKDESVLEDHNELTQEEKRMAENLGLIKNDNNDEKNDDKQINDDSKNEKESSVLKEEDYDTFDKVHDLYENNKEKFYTLPRAVKNQYHNAKGLYKRVKEFEEKIKKAEAEEGFNKIQEAVSKVKLERLAKRIAEAKLDPDLKGLTVEEVEEIIDLKRDTISNDDRPLTRHEFEELRRKEEEAKRNEEQKFIAARERSAERIKESELYAKNNIKELTDGKYDKFDDVVTLAHEVAKIKPRFAASIADAINGNDPVEEIVDLIISIAKINPKWGTSVEHSNMDIERMEKNYKKQKTSASLASGKGGRVVSYDDLTPEDAVRLTREQWDKLPREVRKRLLMQV